MSNSKEDKMEVISAKESGEMDVTTKGSRKRKNRKVQFSVPLPHWLKVEDFQANAKNNIDVSYSVERILDKRKRKRKVQYLIQWEDSWLEAKVIESCEYQIDKFLATRIDVNGKREYLVKWVNSWQDSIDVGIEFIKWYENVDGD